MRFYSISKDLKRRKLFFKYEKIKRIYKFLQQQQYSLSLSQRIHFSRRLTFLPSNSSIARIQNRCILTGRSRSVYRDFQLTRIQLRHLASFGYLMGIKKSSW